MQFGEFYVEKPFLIIAAAAVWLILRAIQSPAFREIWYGRSELPDSAGPIDRPEAWRPVLDLFAQLEAGELAELREMTSNGATADEIAVWVEAAHQKRQRPVGDRVAELEGKVAELWAAVFKAEGGEP